MPNSCAGVPAWIRSDNGPEFVAGAVRQATHTGPLSTTAQRVIAIGPSRPASTEAAVVTAPSPIPAIKAPRR